MPSVKDFQEEAKAWVEKLDAETLDLGECYFGLKQELNFDASEFYNFRLALLPRCNLLDRMSALRRYKLQKLDEDAKMFEKLRLKSMWSPEKSQHHREVLALDKLIETVKREEENLQKNLEFYRDLPNVLLDARYDSYDSDMEY